MRIWVELFILIFYKTIDVSIMLNLCQEFNLIDVALEKHMLPASGPEHICTNAYVSSTYSILF